MFLFFDSGSLLLPVVLLYSDMWLFDIFQTIVSNVGILG